MPDLPSGTVTLLFADLHGSTRLVRELGGRYADVLSEYRRLFRSAVMAHGGREVDTQGDAFFVVFVRARDALAAAVAAQRSIAVASWPDGARVGARIGLHTGEPTSTSAGYVGIDVHRASRICAAGHGGQILLSRATHDLVVEELPQGLSLRALGAHHLKDLPHAEHLFQVMVPDLPADFPSVQSLGNLPTNLPRQLTAFIGREQEMAEVKRVLVGASILTLTGAGGCGKTRLAVQAAADLLEMFPDGVWLVELASVSDPALVPKAVALALGVPEQPARALERTVTDHVGARSMLLLLDNCEHLLAPCAELAAALLRACNHLRILATSREALGIAGEQTFRVPSLSLPDPRRSPSPEEIAQSEAVRLFVARAAVSQPGFTLTQNNAAFIARICQQLDGIPLALELAAARVRVLTVEQIGVRLNDRFRLLTGGSRGALPRHQTLRAAMDWSYELLSSMERAMFRRLSVFAGGWTLEAIEAICAGDGVDAGNILDLLAQLADKSLVVVEARSGQARYRLLETVRQYARDRLLESGDAANTRKRHRDWYLALAERADPGLRGSGQAAWLERLNAEHDNLRAALDWSAAESDPDSALRLAGALQWFWFMQGNITEGRVWLERVLSQERVTSLPVRGKALCGAGMMAWRLDEYDRARTLLQESLALFQHGNDAWSVGFVRHHLAHVDLSQGEYSLATAQFEQSLAVFREAGDRWGVAWSLNCLAGVLLRRGEDDRAAPLFAESAALLRAVGDQWLLGHPLSGLGMVAAGRGDHGRAIALLEESLAIDRATGNKAGVGSSLFRLAQVILHQENRERGVALLKESLSLRRELGDRQGIALCLASLAGVEGMQGRPTRAARLWGAAAALLEAIGASLPPTRRAFYDGQVASARAAAGDEAFGAAWGEGRALTLEQAVEYALSSVERQSG